MTTIDSILLKSQLSVRKVEEAFFDPEDGVWCVKFTENGQIVDTSRFFTQEDANRHMRKHVSPLLN